MSSSCSLFCARSLNVVKGLDYDDLLAYETPRTVRIRDWRLGVTKLVLMSSIFLYIIVYEVGFHQVYRMEGKVSGTARLTILEPKPVYQGAIGNTPYCNGTTSTSDPAYSFPSTGKYARDGGGSVGKQLSCYYQDAATLTISPDEQNAAFVASRMHITGQSLPPGSNFTQANTSWTTTSDAYTYVMDPELFTVLIDHSFTSNVGLSRNSFDMAGYLLDAQGNAMDPCAAYASFGTIGCDPAVAVGKDQARDIIPLGSLLIAAGIPFGSLDTSVSNEAASLLNGQTRRYTGCVIYLTIHYTNYYLSTPPYYGTGSFDQNTIQYYYTASFIPNTGYSSSLTSSDGLFATNRTEYSIHGTRIVVGYDGHVGIYFFQSLLINLTAALALLVASSFLTDLLMTCVCPLRRVYSQYKTRNSIRFKDIQSSAVLVGEFKKNEDALEPLPGSVAQLVKLSEKRAVISYSRDAEMIVVDTKLSGKAMGVAAFSIRGGTPAATNAASNAAPDASE